MHYLRYTILFVCILVGTSGCDIFQKPTESDDTTQARGSDIWWNNRMNQEEITTSINTDRPGSADESDNMQTNVGLQP